MWFRIRDLRLCCLTKVTLAYPYYIGHTLGIRVTCEGVMVFLPVVFVYLCDSTVLSKLGGLLNTKRRDSVKADLTETTRLEA